MKYLWYVAFVLLLACCDSSNDPETAQPIPGDTLLVSVDVKGAVALMFGYEGKETRLQTIDANKNIGQPTLTFKGESQGLEKDFYVVEVNSDYYLLVAPTYKQIYFVDKKTGAARQSAFFPIDWLNSGRIACHGETCYFTDSNNALYRLTNFLSTEAKLEQLTAFSDASDLQTDADGTYFMWGQQGSTISRMVFDGTKQTPVPSNVGFWKDDDGYMRLINAEGKIYKYSSGSWAYEKAIPYSVTRIGAINFPQYQTTVGFQYMYDQLMFFGLDAPYKSATPPAPSMSSDVKPYFQYFSAGSGRYFYLLYGLPNKAKELRKLDVTTFNSTTSAVTTTFSFCSVFKALREDILMTVICQSPDGCQDKLAFLNDNGTFTFPDFWGQASIRYVLF